MMLMQANDDRGEILIGSLTVRELIADLLKCDMDAKVYDTDGHPIISAHPGDAVLREDVGKVYVEASF